MDPVRRCPGCHLKVQTLIKVDDGRSYCESCIERMDQEQAAASAPQHTEPEAIMAEDQSASPEADSSEERPPLRAVPAPARRSAPPRPAATTTAGPAEESLIGQTLEALLERERERLLERRGEVEARIRRAESELDAIAERLEHIGGLLSEPAYEASHAA